MTLKQIVECLRNNGFKVTGFSSAFSDSGREVCSHAYVYKGRTHVASISQYDKQISTIAKVSTAYGGQDIFEVIPFSKVTEDYLKNLRQHTEEEFNERKRWTRQYWIRDSIKKTLKDVDEWFSENPELKKKLKEAFALVKDIKEPPSMF